MSELRRNRLTGEWVLYAENRKNRPYEFVKKMTEKETEGTHCPFCKGHEGETTKPVYQDRQQDWSIRVFPNRYPAVSMEKEKMEKEVFYEATAGIGRHEVVVDTPYHTQTLEQFSLEHLQKVLTVIQSRFLEMQQTEYIEQVQIFKNCGADAGMSMRHSHWQLIGLSRVSKRQKTYEEQAEQYAKETEGCLVCDMLSWEKQQEKRVCAETEKFLAITPYASRFSYELWIVPKEHKASFGQMTEEELGELAGLLQKMVRQILVLREEISYNICVVEGGKRAVTEKENCMHWMIQILPRIGGFAGFEYATETYINSVSPETAAKWYRGESEKP